jgi:beta-lactamase superfamily II metal-dependent hydrolase
MTPARKTPRSKRSPRQPEPRAARVRMYDVGFGDCFLLFLPTSDGMKKVLFDCGSIKAGAHRMADVVDRLIDDVREDDGVARIDVVVGTHRHRDHVSGFEQEVWGSVEVGEVWLPWTEDPDDPDATRIREKQASLALHLHVALERSHQLAQARNLGAAAEATAAELALVAANGLSNEKAMNCLHDGFAHRRVQRPRFLPSKTDGDVLRTDALPGVTVYVMGPSRNPDVIRDMEPGEGESYLQLVNRRGPSGEQPPAPFSDSWLMTADAFTAEFPHLTTGQKVLSEIDKVSEENLLGVLGALQKAVNGTSLMLLFRVGGTHLLFPGDAQWGTWRAALDNQSSRALLRKTDFYKIGHHGSHNATPPEFVEDVLGGNFSAMASVKPVANWPEIPRGPLLDALRLKNQHVARSDDPADAVSRGFSVDPRFIEIEIPIT